MTSIAGKINFTTLFNANKVIETVGKTESHHFHVTSTIRNVGKHNFQAFHVVLIKKYVGINYYDIHLVMLMIKIVGEIMKIIIFLQKREILNCLFNNSETHLMIKPKE